ncbi:hypothetical protein M514_12198, partial [Trichuris suis]
LITTNTIPSLLDQENVTNAIRNQHALTHHPRKCNHVGNEKVCEGECTQEIISVCKHYERLNNPPCIKYCFNGMSQKSLPITADNKYMHELEDGGNHYSTYPALPQYLRKSAAMTCGPPGNPLLQQRFNLGNHDNVDQSLPSRSLTNQLTFLDNARNAEQKHRNKATRSLLGDLKANGNWEGMLIDEKIESAERKNVKTFDENTPINKTEPGRGEESEYAYENVPVEQQAAALFREATLFQKSLSAEEFLFLLVQIGLRINLKLGPMKQMIQMLITNGDMSMEIGELTARCIQATAKNSGGRLKIIEFKRILNYFMRLPNPKRIK